MTGMNSFPGFDTVVEPRIAASASRGKHSILRFYMDYPRPEGSYVSHTPQFLIDEYNLQMTPWTSVDLNAVGLSPDYSDENLKTALNNFVSALGNRYDGDSRVGYIQVGLLGFWGEWHTWTEDSTTHGWIPYATKMANLVKTRIVWRQPRRGVQRPIVECKAQEPITRPSRSSSRFP